MQARPCIGVSEATLKRRERRPRQSVSEVP